MLSCNCRILAVDDDPVNQKIISLLLQSLELDCMIAKNGVDAIELFARNQPDVVIMDLMMPEIDGFHASLEIRRREFGTGNWTPIIACSALDYKFVKERCIAAGINDFMPKPFTRDVLQSKIELWLKKRLNTQEHLVAPSLEKSAANKLRWAHVLDEEPIDKRFMRTAYGLEHLDEIYALFQEVTEQQLRDLSSALLDRDTAMIASIAHELKGSSYAIGARSMAQLCAQLEGALQTKDWSEVERISMEVKEAFDQLRLFIQESLESSHFVLSQSLRS